MSENLLRRVGDTKGEIHYIKYKYYELQEGDRGTPMIDEDANAVSGKKNIYGLRPFQARLVLEFMSSREDGWKESQIFSHLKEKWGRDGTDRGKITFFCRCIKDSNGKHIFQVTGKRPRTIQYLSIAHR